MSLYWILALTVTLLQCLSAYPRPADRSRVIFHEININIDRLKKNGCIENDSAFYSPSGRGECTIKALDCSIQELVRVEAECFKQDESERIEDITQNIKMLLNDRNSSLQTNPNNCFCGNEKLEEKPFDEFLDNIVNLLQMLISK